MHALESKNVSKSFSALLKPVFLLCGMTCIVACNDPKEAKPVKSAKLETGMPADLEILRRAAQDSIITDDEVFAYEQTLDDSWKDYSHPPFSVFPVAGFAANAAEMMDVDMASNTLKDPRVLQYDMEQENKTLLHMTFAETSEKSQKDVYLSLTELQALNKDIDMTKAKLHLEDVDTYLSNGNDGVSCYNPMLNIVFLNGHDFFYSNVGMSYTLTHEYGHAYQHKHHPDMEDVPSAFIPDDKINYYTPDTHPENHVIENYADIVSASMSPDNVKSAVRFIIESRYESKDCFDRTRPILYSHDHGKKQTHAPYIHVIKNMMLVAGRHI